MDRKEYRKLNKWKRSLSKRLVECINSFEPESVEFRIQRPHYIMCTIRTKNSVARGISICSYLDEFEFDEKRGRNLAAGRAVKALKAKDDSEPIRNIWDDDFPKNWLIGQVDKLTALSEVFTCKSLYEPTYSC